jgi:hypothetical protein
MTCFDGVMGGDVVGGGAGILAVDYGGDIKWEKRKRHPE